MISSMCSQRIGGPEISLPLTHLVTAVTLLVKLNASSLICVGNQQLGELECPVELPSQPYVHFVSSLSGWGWK